MRRTSVAHWGGAVKAFQNSRGGSRAAQASWRLVWLCLPLGLVPAAAGATTVADFAAFGSASCLIGYQAEVTDSAAPGDIASLLVGGMGNVDVRLGAIVGGVRAGNSLHLGKGAGAGFALIRGDTIGNADIEIVQGATVQGDVDGGSTVLVGQNGHVTGDVTAGAGITVDPTAVVGGTLAPFSTPASVPNIALPAVSTITPGVTAVGNGTSGQTVAPVPGAWSTLHVGASSQVSLSAGEYHFSSIDIGQNSTLVLNVGAGQEIAILVAGDVDIGNALSIRIGDGTGDQDARRKETAPRVYLETHGRFLLQQNGQWVGTAVAPFDEVVFGTSTHVWGAGYGVQVELRQGALLDYDAADRFSGPDAVFPRIDLALYAEDDVVVGRDVVVDFAAPVGANHDIKVKRGGQTGSVRAGGKLFTGLDAEIHGSQIGNRRVYVRRGSHVLGSVDGGTTHGRIVLGPESSIEGVVNSAGDVLQQAGATVTCGTPPCIFENSAETAFHSSLDLEAVIGPATDVAGALAAVPGRPDIDRSRGISTTLAPGVYGTLSLGARNGLSLSSGEYFFESIQAGEGLALELDLSGGEIAIFVLGNAIFGHDLTVEVTGDDATGIFLEVQGPRVLFGSGGQWIGTIWATGGDVIFGQGTTLTGAIFAGRDIVLKRDNSVVFALADRLLISGSPSGAFLEGEIVY